MLVDLKQKSTHYLHGLNAGIDFKVIYVDCLYIDTTTKKKQKKTNHVI